MYDVFMQGPLVSALVSEWQLEFVTAILNSVLELCGCTAVTLYIQLGATVCNF